MSSRPSFQDLDWPKLLAFTEGEARTPYGKARISALSETTGFAQSRERAQELQQETQETAAILERSALWGPLNGLEEVDDLFENLKRGGVLEVAALVRLRSWLHALESWNQFPKELAGRLFKQALQNLFDPFDCLRVLARVLTPSGELSERASPKLSTLYSQAREIRREISIRMESLLRDYGAKGVLQENYSDVRDGRYVLPVRVSDQSKVDGRIAELSVSRQTVFIEPAEVEQLQSRLRRVEADTAQEIFVILMGVSRELAPYSERLDASVSILGYWVAVLARARIAN